MIPGDPGAVEAAAGALAVAGSEFVEARDSVAAHARATTAEWTGLASMMALTKSEQYAAKILHGADACRAAEPVLRVFAAELRAAQQQYADAQARLAAGQAQIDGAGSGAPAAADAARAQGQAAVAEAAGAMNAARLRAQRANEVAAGQIDGIIGELAGMRTTPPAVATPPPPPEDDGGGFSLSDLGHLALDGVGLVPVVGEVADGANAAWYAAEGDYTNAALSAAAMVPVAGWGATAAKGVNKGIDAARGCFVAGTTVLTVDGHRPIESLLMGDEVVTGDPHSGRRAIHPVKTRFRHTVPVVLRLTVQEIQISCSPEHPFWTEASGWKKAVDLNTGDLLVDADGVRRPISTITRQEGTFAVYNIEVDGLHTYYVSELHLLVHNKAMRVPRPEGTPKKVDDKYLKRHGVDPHKAKEDLPGAASRFDIYVDRNGNMFGVPKGGKPENGEYLGHIEDS